jgi:hypothetical protein
MPRYRPVVVGVAVTGVFWLVAGILMLASWHSTGQEKRVRTAPACAPIEVFTGALCRAVLPGTITKFTSGELDVTVGGRDIASTVTISGPLPNTEQGIPARVTLYRGVVVHVESDTGLYVDTDAAPTTKSRDYRNFGFCFLVFGFAIGIYSGFKTARARDEEVQDVPAPEFDARDLEARE